MDHHQSPQRIVENYIKAYNSFDTNGMLRDLHDEVLFENISHGQTTLTTHGIEAFKNQAESASKLFQKREQKITSMTTDGDTIEVQIEYTGIVANDLPNGLKAGDTINLTGKSTFVLKEGKISHIKDES